MTLFCVHSVIEDQQQQWYLPEACCWAAPDQEVAWTVHHNTNLTLLGHSPLTSHGRAFVLGHLSSLRPHWSKNLRVHTEWWLPISGVHPIMMEKSAMAGEGGGYTPTTFQPITMIPSRSKLQIRSCRYTPSISSLPYMYFVVKTSLGIRWEDAERGFEYISRYIIFLEGGEVWFGQKYIYKDPKNKMYLINLLTVASWCLFKDDTEMTIISLTVCTEDYVSYS